MVTMTLSLVMVINGKALEQGDRVLVFYIESDNAQGSLAGGAINGSNFNLYSSKNYDDIKSQLYSEVNLVTPSVLPNITTSNDYNSTTVKICRNGR